MISESEYHKTTALLTRAASRGPPPLINQSVRTPAAQRPSLPLSPWSTPHPPPRVRLVAVRMRLQYTLDVTQRQRSRQLDGAEVVQDVLWRGGTDDRDHTKPESKGQQSPFRRRAPFRGERRQRRGPPQRGRVRRLQRSAHAPRVNHGHSCCSSGSCQHTKRKEGEPPALKQQSGPRRPWMISH